MNHKQFAIRLARQAGVLMRENFVLGMKKELKSDLTPVTVTDLAINDMVSKEVATHYPDYGLISEEGGDFSGQKMTWVCDPIDGTIPFSRGVPTCVFMLALIEDGASILGVIYDPFMDRLYFAQKGQGAYLNDKKIFVSNDSNLEDTAVSLLT